MRTTLRTAATVTAVLLLGAACGDDEPASSDGTTTTTTEASAPVVDPGDGGDYQPQIDPADFVAEVDNPYLPLTPGARWVYEGESDGDTERVVVEVLDETRDIQGITATVVLDTVWVNGEKAEETHDWYAQDRDGNVWYLGEDTYEIEDGERTTAAGSWEHGVDGALGGIVMPARPEVGAAYRQEFYEGEAEDMAEVLQTGATSELAIGTYTDVVVTEDWTPLEPDVVEEKGYAPGVGQIYEETTAGGEGRLELVEHTPG